MKHILIFSLLLSTVLGFSQTVQTADAIGFGGSMSPLVKVKKDRKEYFYHLDGNHFIDDVEEHDADLFVVVKKGHYGVLNNKGNMVVPIDYDEIELATEYEGQWYAGIPYDYKYIILKKDGKTGVADDKGNIIIPLQFQNATVINKNSIGIAKNNLWGWASASDGKLVHEPEYEYITKFFSDEYVEVRTADKSGLAKASGQVIIPVEYDDYLRYIVGGKQTYIEGTKNKQLYLMDTTGTILLSGNTDYKAIEGSKLLIFKQKDLFGVIDPITQKVIVSPAFESLGPFIRNLGIAKKSGKYGVVDMQGKTLLDFQFEEIRFLAANGHHKYDTGSDALTEKMLVRKPPEDVRLKLIYEQQINQAPYFIEVTKAGKKGLYSWNGKTIIPCGKYKNIQFHYYRGKSFFLVDSELKSGIVDETGTEILPVQYTFNDSYQYSKEAVQNEFDLANRFIVFSEGKEEGSIALKIGLFDLDQNEIIFAAHEQYITLLNHRFFLLRKLIADYNYEFLLYDIKQRKLRKLGADITDVHVVNDSFLQIETKEGVYQLTTFDGTNIYANPSWKVEGNYHLIRFPNYNKHTLSGFYFGLKKIYAGEGNLFIDTLGQEKRFTGIDQVDCFYDGYAVAAKKIENKEASSGFKYLKGMIDLEGKTVVPFEYNEVYAAGADAEMLVFARKDSQMLVRRDGTVILGAEYHDIETSSAYPNFTFAKGSKYGLADWAGNILVAPLYDDIRRNYEGDQKTWPLLVKEGDWYYFVGKDGQKYSIKAKERSF